MTRVIAVISDIHGNMRALDAVLEDITRRGIADIVNLGDCAYGPFDPTPVMDRLLTLNLPTVSGNEDRLLVEQMQGPLHSPMAAFNAKALGRAHVEWLANLPSILSVYDAILFHGIPGDDTRYLLTSVEPAGTRARTAQEIEQRLLGHNNALVLCGHDHTPRVVKLADGRVVVNPGSIGCPAYRDDVPLKHGIEKGTPHAQVAIVTMGNHVIDVELASIDYDWQAASREAEDNGFPDWAQWIATGCV